MSEDTPPCAIAIATRLRRAYDTISPPSLIALFDEKSEDAACGVQTIIPMAAVAREGVSIVAKLLEKLNDSVQASDDRTALEYPVDIPIFTAEHESRLMTECYLYPLPDGRTAKMLPCGTGSRCMGMHPKLEGHQACGGIVLRGILTPEELTTFEQTGKNPDDARLCVMCARYYVAEAYFWCQDNHDSRVSRNTIINWYVNPRDCPGGYKSEFTLPIGAYPAWNGMCGPIVCNSLHRMRLVRRGPTWIVDQSDLIWKDPKLAREESHTAAQLFR